MSMGILSFANTCFLLPVIGFNYNISVIIVFSLVYYKPTLFKA